MPELQPYMTYIYYVAAAAGAIVVLLLLAAIFRRLRRGTRGGKGERLGINEYCEIDETRRLVLVRRDGVEHLILIGGPQDLVVESGIGARAHAQHPVDEAMATASFDAEEVVPFRAAPRAPIFGTRRTSLRAVDDGQDEDGPQRA